MGVSNMSSIMFENGRNTKEVLEYFKAKADRYDEVDKQFYWRLSDKLVWHLLDDNVLSKLPKDFNFLDAGGGTGRWSKKILQNYPHSRGTIYDISPEMLKQAEMKRVNGLEDRLTLIQGSIEDLKIENDIFDLSFTFHNVLGFVENPKRAVSEMQRSTVNGGYIVSIVPNLYHNIFFNISLGNIDSAEEYLKTNKGKFTKDMPYIHLFTPESIGQIYNDLNIGSVSIFGFPVAIYPGYQETQISGSTEKLKDLLSNEQVFDRVFSIEKNLSSRADSSSRGNNIFIIGRKNKNGL